MQQALRVMGDLLGSCGGHSSRDPSIPEADFPPRGQTPPLTPPRTHAHPRSTQHSPEGLLGKPTASGALSVEDLAALWIQFCGEHLPRVRFCLFFPLVFVK